ncbi:MAG TPA: hypothetical protein VF898_14340 [Chloroflexota bacterium]
MKRRVSPPVVASALSGFVVGVFFTLIATGLIVPANSSSGTGQPLPPVRNLAESQAYQRVHKLVVRRLGPAYPDPKQNRLLYLYVTPAEQPSTLSLTTVKNAHYRSVYITYRVNEHPLGKSWRLRAAKADAFSVMQALYTANLGIYNVWMFGKFPEPHNGKIQDATVLIAYMDHRVATTIPWRSWGREDEERLWNRLPTKWLYPPFA